MTITVSEFCVTQAQFPCFKVSGFPLREARIFCVQKHTNTRRSAQRSGTSLPMPPMVKKWRILYAESHEKIFYFQAGQDCWPASLPAGRSFQSTPSAHLLGAGLRTLAGFCPRLAQGFASAAGTFFPVAFKRLCGNHTNHDIQRRRTS